MILAIDVGNTRTVLGLFKGKRLKKTWNVESKRIPLLRLSRKLPRGIEGVILSNVVPSLQKTLLTLTKRYRKKCRALFVNPYLKMPIRIRIRHPFAVGADRIVNAVAAYIKYGAGRVLSLRKGFAGGVGPPAETFPRATRLIVIIDFGTATTFDVVTSRGDFIGGAIAPGLKIANEALAERCARLPRVPLRQPKKVIGRDTVQAIRAGVFYGYLSLVEGMIDRMKRELGLSPQVIATGGLAPLIAPSVPAINLIDPHLTLHGLRILYEWNKAG